MNTNTWSKKKAALASILFEIGAVNFGRFILKLHEARPNAPLSPIYFDLRKLRSNPEAMDLAVDLLEELTAPLRFDMYADIPTGATPIVSILSYKTKTAMISPRRIKKRHGLIKEIDGVFTAGQLVLLIDDVLVTGDSKLEIIEILQRNGLVVQDIAVLIDREQTGSEFLEKAGYRVHAVFKQRELLAYYVESGMISQERYLELLDYIAKSTQPEEESAAVQMLPELRQLDAIARELSNGNVQPALQRLRSIVRDLDLPVIMPETDERIFPALYLTKQIVNALWVNFNTDATFEAPPPELLASFAKDLGFFLTAVLAGEAASQMVSRHLFAAINQYYKLLVSLNEQSKETSLIDWEKIARTTSIGG